MRGFFLNDLSKYCPRKYAPFVQSPNWTSPILGRPKIWTPIYTSRLRALWRPKRVICRLSLYVREGLISAWEGLLWVCEGLCQPQKALCWPTRHPVKTDRKPSLSIVQQMALLGTSMVVSDRKRAHSDRRKAFSSRQQRMTEALYRPGTVCRLARALISLGGPYVGLWAMSI